MDRKKSNGQIAGLSPKTMIIIATVSALIAFLAVYGTLSRDDNTPPGQNVNTDTTKPGAASSTSKKNHDGALAAFVYKNPPAPLTDILFRDGNGDEVRLSDFQGKVVLLNLWATWCAPCREEMPALDRLAADLRSDQFDVVALAIDRAGIAGAKKFLDETNVKNLAVYVDKTARGGAALKAIGLPTTILIDDQGREIGRLAGPAEWDSEAAKAIINKALRK